MGQGYQRVWSSDGEEERAYLGVLAQTSLGRNVLLGYHLTQKEYELGPLNACHRGR